MYTEQSVGAALQTLAAARVLSAPLALRTSAAADSYMVLAFLSISDFLRAFVERASRAVPFDAPLLSRMASLSALGHDFCAECVIALHASDDGDVLYKGATGGMTLLALVRGGLLRMPFTRPRLPPRHRVGVFDASGVLRDIVSMSNIVEFVHAHVDALGPLARRTLAELGLAGCAQAPEPEEGGPAAEAVVTVPTTMPTDVAFGVLVHREVSGLGVVDEASGVLVANLSESDFRAFGAHDFGSLALPVGEFLVHKRNLSVPAADEAAGERAGGGPAEAARPSNIRDAWARALHAGGAAIALQPSDTLMRCLETLVGNGVHRLYVVDPLTHAPRAVVTATDILGVLVRGHKPTP